MLTNQRVKFIQECRLNRETYEEIANKLGVTKQYIGEICKQHNIVKGPKLPNLTYYEKATKRFMSRVNVTDKCWEFVGCKDKVGYGRFSFEGKNEYAHRVSYKMFKGFVAPSVCVRQRCNNRLCVNPAHLSLGHRKQRMI